MSHSLTKVFYIGLLIFLSIPFTSTAQYNFTIQGQSLVPQRNYLNPAFIPESRWHLGIPALSSNHFSGGLSSHTYAQLIRKNSANGDSLYIDLQNALDKMPKTGFLSFNANIDLLSFSYRFGAEMENMIFFNMTERLSLKMSYPRALLEFIWKGNAAFLGETVDFAKLNLDASHFREYGLTYARQLLDKQLSVGLTVKYLYGMENISTDNTNFSVFTDANTYDITANSDFRLNSSGLLTSDAFDDFSGGIGRYLFGRNNHGFAFNVGGHYKGEEDWEVALSVLDMGAIFWKDNPQNYVMDNATFTYSGMDIAQFLSNDSADYFQEFADSLIETFDIVETQEEYTSVLPTRIYVNGAYNFTEKDRLGLDFYGEIFKNHFEPAVALNYTHKFGTIFHLSTSYMYNNHSFANLGIGFALTLGPVQWYLNLDNMLAPIIPQHSQNFHFHSGLNFVVGYKDKADKKESDRDNDGIIDRLDNCPDEYGLEIFAGCPDRDLDSIPDISDDCPDVFGHKDNRGCPWGDKDQDGITDNEDDCPNTAGPKENKGCPWPDSDGDGINDNEDKCPDIFGPVENNGCPWGDKDEDGVLDNVDKCPDVKGPVENDGCPWGDRDADGVLDNQDRCPDVPGPADNDGCPYQDSDGDGVIDIEDDCPRTPGPASNNGCPIIEQEEQAVLNTAFDNLEFETGSDVIRASSYASLDELSELLKSKSDYKLRISGHTDATGSAEINMKISENRAKSVQRYLSNKGVDSSRLVAEWFGETEPKYPNNTPEGRQKNRRVEMEVMFD